MKKLSILAVFFAVVFHADAKRKPVEVFLEDEFNPWFQYDEPVRKLGPVDNSHSTIPLPSKMDRIDPDSTVYKPTKLVFKNTRPNSIPIPTKKVIKKMLFVPRKLEKMSDEFDLKR
jgi:hypothetical protein